MATSYLGRTDLPRGIRNNNPGNLVLTDIQWKGKIPNAQNTDGHFEQYIDVETGIRAMAMDIIGDISEGKNTLTKLINEYAPSFENNTGAYISSVSKATGLSPNDIIPMDTCTVAAIIKAKIGVENGAVAFNYISDKNIEDGLALVPEKFLQKKSLLGCGKYNWIVYLVVLVLVTLVVFWILK
jgi:hypothetical protein